MHIIFDEHAICKHGQFWAQAGLFGASPGASRLQTQEGSRLQPIRVHSLFYAVEACRKRKKDGMRPDDASPPCKLAMFALLRFLMCVHAEGCPFKDACSWPQLS